MKNKIYRGRGKNAVLHETAYLNPKLTIHFEDKRKTEPEVIDYHEPEGIIGFVRDLNRKKRDAS